MTDRTDRIAGTLLGTAVGDSLGLPREGLSARRARRFPGDGSSGEPVREMPLLWPAVLPRNLLFLVVVLAHGFRRLLPPY